MPSNSLPTHCPLMFVMNAASGHNDASATREEIERLLKEAGRPYQMCIAQNGAQIEKTAMQAVTSAKASGGAVVAVGGDGTINAVANAVLGSGCALGVLPQGTFNYFGRSHGIPEDLTQAVHALLNARPIPVQVGLVNDKVFLVNASVGLYPQLLEDREAYKQQYGRSRLVAFWSGLMTVFRQHRQLRITLEQGAQTTSLRTPTLFIGNNRLQMQQIGIPLAEAIQEGQLAAIAVRPVGTLAMLWLAVRGALGKLGEAENVINFSFKRLVVKPSSLYRAKRVKVAIDGEVIWLNPPLEFRVSPEMLCLLKDESTSTFEAITKQRDS